MFEFVAQSSFKKNFDLFLYAFDDCEGMLLHFPILFKLLKNLFHETDKSVSF